MLKPRRQRSARHLNRKEFEIVVVVCAGDAIGLHQWLSLKSEAKHRKFAVAKAKAAIPRRGEAE
jgi:hypothetical protein